MEVEAKFSVPDRDTYRKLARCRELASYRLIPTETAEVSDRYLDTPSGALLAAGYACRLRTEGERVIATLKGLGGAQGATHRREELEVVLPAWTADPAAWPEGETRDLALDLTHGERLEPLFDLSQLRRRMDVRDADRPVAELSLDAVRASIGRRPALYYELEIELLPEGREEDLAALSKEIGASWHLQPEERSKFERGLAALRSRGSAVTQQLSARERAELEAIAAGGDDSLLRRAAVILGWADGQPTRDLTKRTGLSGGRVRHWVRGFRAHRMEIFKDSVGGREGPAPREDRGRAGQTARPKRDRRATGDRPPAVTDEQSEQAAQEIATAVSVVGASPAGSSPHEAPVPRPPSPGSPRSSSPVPTIMQFCRQHGVDLVHARHVADQARALFDMLRPVHGLPRKRRRLLKYAALLYTAGTAGNPEDHAQAGRDLILAQPLRRVSTMERLALACIVALNREKARPRREPTFQALDEETRTHTLVLTALVRVAEALDFSHSQSTQIQSVDGVDAEHCEIVVDGPQADMDALEASSHTDLWYQLFTQELVVVPAQRPHASDLEGATSLIPADVSAEESAMQPQIPGLSPEEPMSEAGRKVFRVQFLRMLANEPGARSGQDDEAVHDMRVATRRLRAAIPIFEPYFERKALKAFNKQLRRAAKALGGVRDLDVLIEKARAYAAELPPEESGSLEPLLADWRTRREVARRQMLDLLDGESYRKFTAIFEAFLETAGAGARQSSPDEPEPFQVRHVIPGLILTRYQNVRAFEPLIPGAPLPTMHRLRIEGKRLRYALEFFRDVLGPEAGDLVKQVVALQDALGTLQDSNVAMRLISEFLDRQRSKRKKKKAEAAPDETFPAVERYLEHQQALQREMLTQFSAPWAVIVGYDFRRALGLAVAAP